MLHIREAGPNDARDVERLYGQLVSDAAVRVLPERLSAVAADPNTALFVSLEDDRVVGTALVSICADVMYGVQPYAVVENVVVDERHRGRQIGISLLQHVEAFCCARGCSKVMLLSTATRERAHRFFVRAGYSASAKVGFVKYGAQMRKTYAT